MTPRVPVLAAPLIDPGSARVDFEVPQGTTIADIVAQALPDASAGMLARCRVTLVSDKGTAVIPSHLWHRVRPFAGVRVVIRLVPGKNALRSLLQIVVSIAAIALGQIWGAALAGTWGLSATAWSGIVGLGVNLVGNMLINALIPPTKPKQPDKETPFYSVSGWRNPITPGGPVPDLMGTHRIAPHFAAPSYTEVAGDWQYIRAIFTCGYGPVSISALRIGETPIESYDEVDIEIREGLPDDLPVTLYPRQVLEDSHGKELLRPLPRDDTGTIIDGPATEKPVTVYSASDASEISAIFGFPAGLVEYGDGGNRQAYAVTIRIRQRLASTTPGDWIEVATLTITAAKGEGFYRQHTWQPPSRDRWEVEFTMMTDENRSAQVSARTVLVALQSIRPEYPLHMGKPLPSLRCG